MTSPVTPETYAVIQHEFLALRDLTGIERDLRLEEIAQRLPDAIGSIRRLLAADVRDDEFLEVPLVNHKNMSICDTTNIAAGNFDSAQHPEYVGPFRILQQIGEGGHGLVFMAEQKSPIRRRVAIKWIKPGMDSSLVLARFEAERQALALMSHPSIANVIDAGRTETGQPYFVMELVHGAPIDRFCDTNELGLEERLQIFCQVCDAVHHAHRKGIIHRDIKPNNVLVTVDSGSPLAKVIDFGIAKALHVPLTEKTLFTEYGQILGTLEYMSPEQATMSQSGIDVRSDVYALGVLLYVLITGETPLNKEQLLKDGIFELKNALQQIQPQTPSLKITTNSQAQRWRDHSDSAGVWAKSVQGDLDWVTMKALAKQPENRYDSAAEFAQDIQQFLAGEVVTARPPSRIYLSKKWFARHRVMATISAAMLSCILICTAALWWAYTKSQDNLSEANDAQATVKAQSQQLERSLDLSRLETARADSSAKKLSRLLQKQMIESAWKEAVSGNFDAARDQLAEIPGDEAVIETGMVMTVANQMQLPVLRPSERGTIRRLAVHHGSGTLAILNAKSELELYDLAKLKEKRVVSLPDLIYSACEFSRDGSQLLLASLGSVVRIDLKAARVEASVDVAQSSIRDLVHDPMHEQWVLTTGANVAYFIDQDSLRPTAMIDLGIRVADVALTHDSKHALVAGLDGRLLVIPMADSTQFKSITRSQHKIVHFRISSDSVTVVDSNGAVETISNDRLNLLHNSVLDSSSVLPMKDLVSTRFDIVPSPVGVTFASNGMLVTATGGRILLRQSDGRSVPIHDVAAKIKQVVSLPLSDDLLIIFPSGMVSFLPADVIRRRIAEFKLLSNLVDAVPMANGKFVVTANSDGELQRWSRDTMTLKQRKRVHNAAVLEIDTHAERQLVASIGEDRRLVISNAPRLQPLHERHVGWGVRCVQFSRDGSLLAAAPDAQNRIGLQEGTIDLWDTKTGLASVRLIGHQNWVLKVAFSDSDERLATLAVDETARIWATRTGDTVAVIRLAGLPTATSMAFRPDGALLMIGHEDGSMTTWESSSGQLLDQHQLATDEIMSLHFINEGARLLAITRSQDGLIIVDPDRLDAAIHFSIGSGGVAQSRIDETSRSLGIVTNRGRVYFWHWQIPHLLE